MFDYAIDQMQFTHKTPENDAWWAKWEEQIDRVITLERELAVQKDNRFISAKVRDRDFLEPARDAVREYRDRAEWLLRFDMECELRGRYAPNAGNKMVARMAGPANADPLRKVRRFIFLFERWTERKPWTQLWEAAWVVPAKQKLDWWGEQKLVEYRARDATNRLACMHRAIVELAEPLAVVAESIEHGSGRALALLTCRSPDSREPLPQEARDRAALLLAQLQARRKAAPTPEALATPRTALSPWAERYKLTSHLGEKLAVAVEHGDLAAGLEVVAEEIEVWASLLRRFVFEFFEADPTALERAICNPGGNPGIFPGWSMASFRGQEDVFAMLEFDPGPEHAHRFAEKMQVLDQLGRQLAEYCCQYKGPGGPGNVPIEILIGADELRKNLKAVALSTATDLRIWVQRIRALHAKRGGNGQHTTVTINAATNMPPSLPAAPPDGGGNPAGRAPSAEQELYELQPGYKVKGPSGEECTLTKTHHLILEEMRGRESRPVSELMIGTGGKVWDGKFKPTDKTVIKRIQTALGRLEDKLRGGRFRFCFKLCGEHIVRELW